MGECRGQGALSAALRAFCGRGVSASVQKSKAARPRQALPPPRPAITALWRNKARRDRQLQYIICYQVAVTSFEQSVVLTTVKEIFLKGGPLCKKFWCKIFRNSKKFSSVWQTLQNLWSLVQLNKISIHCILGSTSLSSHRFDQLHYHHPKQGVCKIWRFYNDFLN